MSDQTVSKAEAFARQDAINAVIQQTYDRLKFLCNAATGLASVAEHSEVTPDAFEGLSDILYETSQLLYPFTADALASKDGAL